MSDETRDDKTEAPGVKITGATPAGEDLFAGWNDEENGEAAGASAELPHWTENPTGQVPAVLSREDSTSEDPWASVQSPTWREDDSDWSAEEEAFDPSLLSVEEEEPKGVLGSEPALEESQPWEFDLASQEAASAEPSIAQDAPDVDDLDAELAASTAIETEAPPVRRRGGAHSRSGSSERGRARSRREGGDDVAPAPRTGRSGEGGGSDRNLPTAAITGIIIALLVLVTFDVGTVLAMALVTVVVLLAAAEAYAAFRKGRQHPATLIGLVATVTLLIATYNRGTQALGLVTVLLLLFTVVWFMAGHDRENMLTGLASTVLVYTWVGVFGSFAALLLNPNLFPDRHGLAFLLGAILATIAYDIAALFVGSSFGKRPIAPTISPAKTVEGLIGGSAAAILVSVIVVQLIHPWTLASALTLGIVVSIVAPLGDLTESMIKRSLGLKDMGRLLPGHGGMLDRVDGLLFVLPATYFLVRAFHLG
jgi:phosphatidate cytidylyltransferase